MQFVSLVFVLNTCFKLYDLMVGFCLPVFAAYSHQYYVTEFKVTSL